MRSDQGENDLAHVKVLLAEDNPVNLLYIRKTLERQGIRVVQVQDGDQVVPALLEHNDVDLVLMDISMPTMDGLETTARIRASAPDAINPDLPIIALTAHAMRGDKETFLKQGMDGYLAKPVKPRELIDTIRQVVRAKQVG